jgi:hypothetical protein
MDGSVQAFFLNYAQKLKKSNSLMHRIVFCFDIYTVHEQQAVRITPPRVTFDVLAFVPPWDRGLHPTIKRNLCKLPVGRMWQLASHFLLLKITCLPGAS